MINRTAVVSCDEISSGLSAALIRSLISDPEQVFAVTNKGGGIYTFCRSYFDGKDCYQSSGRVAVSFIDGVVLADITETEFKLDVRGIKHVKQS